MNAELEKKLAQRRQWEATSHNANSSSEPSSKSSSEADSSAPRRSKPALAPRPRQHPPPPPPSRSSRILQGDSSPLSPQSPPSSRPLPPARPPPMSSSSSSTLEINNIEKDNASTMTASTTPSLARGNASDASQNERQTNLEHYGENKGNEATGDNRRSLTRRPPPVPTARATSMRSHMSRMSSSSSSSSLSSSSGSITSAQSTGPEPEPLGAQLQTSPLAGAKFLPPPGRRPSMLRSGQRASARRPDRPPPPRRRYKDPNFAAGNQPARNGNGQQKQPERVPSPQIQRPTSINRTPPPLPPRDEVTNNVEEINTSTMSSQPSAALTELANTYNKMSSPEDDVQSPTQEQTPIHHRGPADFRKPRPNSANFQPINHSSSSSSLPATTSGSGEARTPPPIPTRGLSQDLSSAVAGSRTSLDSTGSRRPPAPTREATRRSIEHEPLVNLRRDRSESPPVPERRPSPERLRTAAQASISNKKRFSTHESISSSQISEEERHALAEHGKSIFQRTMSSDPKMQAAISDNTDDGTTDAGNSLPAAEGKETQLEELRKSYQYARVIEPFDPIELGYAEEEDEDEFLTVDFDDVIEIKERCDDDWWEGSIFDQTRGRIVGYVGKFPAAFVEPIPDPYWVEGDDEMQAAVSMGVTTEASFGDPGEEAPTPGDTDEAKAMHKRWRNANRLFLALLELVTNEFKYVLSLQICFEVYVEGILNSLGGEYVGALFPSWERIWQCHEDILYGLAAASKESWRKLQAFPEKPSPRTSNRDKSRRKSVGASMNSLRKNTEQMKSLANSLDSLQIWHDQNVLEQEDTLSEDDLQHFLKLLAEWAVDLCSALETMAGRLKISSVYIRNYNDALRLMDIWTKEVPKFAQTIRRLENNPIVNGLNLSSYLIKPVQHVCRYPLLVREVHKYAPDDETKEAVLACQLRLLEVTDEVNSLQNEAGSSGENSLTLLELRQGLRYRSESERSSVDNVLCKHTTQLMKFGPLRIIKCGSGTKMKDLRTAPSGPPYECFLLNSIVLIADKYQNLLSKSRYKLRCYIDIKNIGVVGPVESHTGTMFGFSIKSSKDPNPTQGDLTSKPDKWIFAVEHHAERDAWLRNVEQAIYITRGVSKSGAAPTSTSATEAYNAAHGRSPIVSVPTHAPPNKIPQDDNSKFNSMKDRQTTLQNAHPSFLLQLQKEDPLINELQNILRVKRSQQQQQQINPT